MYLGCLTGATRGHGTLFRLKAEIKSKGLIAYSTPIDVAAKAPKHTAPTQSVSQTTNNNPLRNSGTFIAQFLDDDIDTSDQQPEKDQFLKPKKLDEQYEGEKEIRQALKEMKLEVSTSILYSYLCNPSIYQSTLPDSILFSSFSHLPMYFSVMR